MNLFFANEHEAEQLTRRNSGTWLRVLREQPPEKENIWPIPSDINWKYLNKYAEMWTRAWDGNTFRWRTPLCYPSGVYGVKEWWAWDMDEGYVYLADDLPENTPHGKGYWQSPVTMPAEAIRWHDVKIDTTVKRVQEVSEEEARSMGNFDNHEWGYNCLRWFEDYWNSLHAKPVNKGDRYVCYPYSLDKWALEYCGKKDMGLYTKKTSSGTWKGKPLTIHANPFGEVISGEKTSEVRI